MKLSVIICLYNTEKEHFDNCLNSIYTSTLKDFEVIVIDDGSTIDYGEILEKYHPVYVKTNNRGHLAARTYGLMLAKGEYVAYVDSDDSVTFNYHMPMVDVAYDKNADIIINDWAFKTASTIAACQSDTTISTDLSLDGDEILNQYAKHQGRQHSYFVLWNKVFKRELLLKAKAEIEKTNAIMNRMTYSEDMLITFFAFKFAKKLENIHTGYYFYTVHNGQTIVADTSKKIKDQIDMTNISFDIMLENSEDNKYANEIKENILAWKALMSRTHYSYAKAQGDKELCSYVRERYNVDKLTTSKPKDSFDYIASNLLGDNFEGIDKIFRFIYKKGKDVSVNYDKSDEYIAKCIGYLAQKENIRITFSKNAEITIPKRTSSLKNKLFHSKLAYAVGLTLFPKGSSLRKKLKNSL